MNIALLTAAGSGTRMHQDIPKQFLHVDNKPVIIHTMEAFQRHPSIDAIIVVTIDSWSEVVWAYAKQFNIDKLKWVVPGGSTGQESIHNGLVTLANAGIEEDIVVMIHDGNRPLVTSEIISDSLATFKKYGSAVAVIPCTEVVFESEDGFSSCVSTEREKLFRTQTPHTYRLNELLEAHKEAAERGIEGTAASCMLMKELGKMTYFSKGSEANFKLTTLEDLSLFKALLTTKQEDWIKG
ncbi:MULTISPECIES: IspD/TarI family cytidylyltransferase [Ruminococcus]|uniref:2-C-methyl-D-erythritol 4-phosphate cytidylyltransferase n=1 Tax=Ruminococcus flavefaciens TaxID=1265 RepID=A0A1M7J4S6_RUMFL|nr:MULTISPECIES: IspD/TarI family cytidylyltransferase [Ruminococcus]MCR4796209.1 2-C-methyl-D-erythritol 4-phosphate cytidylyltransferase [Ruminococcus sp.]SHM47901.1 2-C-methyl-D-erythritol 4-phosphate cytidylyltransferase [Ruminococcus flavefaciens]